MKRGNVLAVLALLAACTPTAAVRPSVPQTKQECLAKGGNWTHVGLPGLPKRCDLKTTDGGNSCADSRYCQGECLAPENATEGVKTTGTCSSYVTEFGCRSRIENGRVGIKLCVD